MANSKREASDQRYEELKQATRVSIISIIVYIVMCILKIIFGKLGHSESLYADGLNNFTDIFGSVAVLIGLKIARIPIDRNHPYGHWRSENIASLIVSFIMFMIGFDLVKASGLMLIHKEFLNPEPLTSLVGFICGIVLLTLCFYNKKMAHKLNSTALKAQSQDNLSDAIISFSAGIAVFTNYFHVQILDAIVAVLISLFIIKIAIGIFKDNVFVLSDGFDKQALNEYQEYITNMKDIKGVKRIKGRHIGTNIFLDVVVYLDGNLTVKQSHAITETIERELLTKFNIFDVDVHVEPEP